jgi:maltose/maltodextrin transport system permease protein
MKFRGKRQALTGLMLMQMFPAVLALVAIYAVFDRLGNAFPAIGIDTHWALLLAYSGGIALHVWTIKGYYDTIPRRSRRPPRSTARRRGRPSAWCCCRWRCRS